MNNQSMHITNTRKEASPNEEIKYDLGRMRGLENCPAVHGHTPEQHFECPSQMETESKSVLS